MLLQEYGSPLQFISPYEYQEKIAPEAFRKDGEVYRSVSTELANTHFGNITPQPIRTLMPPILRPS